MLSSLSDRSSRKSPRLAGATANPTPGRASAPRSVRQRTHSGPGPARPGPALQTPGSTTGQATAATLLSDQAQANAANAAQRTSAASADAQLLQRIENAIASRQQAPTAAQAITPGQPSNQAQTGASNGTEPNERVLQRLERLEAALASAALASRAPTASPTAPRTVTDLTDPELTGTATDLEILAARLAAGMLLAALRPETMPALLSTITTCNRPTVTAYITTVQNNLGPGHTTSLTNLLTAINTIARCAGQVYNAEAYVCINAATDDVKFWLNKLRAAVDPASLSLHETALARRIIDGVTDPATDSTIALLASEYVKKAIRKADDARLKGLAYRPPTHAPTYTYAQAPQHPAPTTGAAGRGNPGGKGQGRGGSKGANAPRLPYFRSAALNRDTRIPTDANGNNVAGACALCGKGLLPGTTGHRASACTADRNTQDNWVYAGIPAQ